MAYMHKLNTAFAAFTLAFAAGGIGSALALDEVTYGTNWLAQAEHGGFYQAVADGTYEKYGLDVTIVQGGPQVPNDALLVSGKIDFYMGTTLRAFDAVKQDIPMIDVAAMFQKDPQVIMAHPDQGVEEFADLAKLDTIFMGQGGFVTYFEWMKALGVGFREEQYKPYAFNPAPFLADVGSGQQGYVTSEPYEIERQAGWAPQVFLLADQGFAPYSTTIATLVKTVEDKPDMVQRFVDASVIGWYNYLYGDNEAANALIRADNPEITDGQIAFSIGKMKEYGIVDSGDALTMGIGCMTDEHYKIFFDDMAAIGLVDADLEYTKAYTTEFVCKKVGMDLKG